jgi:hypothetical protein
MGTGWAALRIDSWEPTSIHSSQKEIIGFPDHYNFNQAITCNKIIGFPDYNFNEIFF